MAARAALTALVTALLACNTAPPPSRGAAPRPAVLAQASAATPEVAPKATFPYSELVTGGAAPSDALPLIVALHGLGDRPDNFLGLFRGFPGGARIAAPHAEGEHGGGFKWFLPGAQQSDETAGAIGAMADRLATFAREMARVKPTLGKPIVMGFSQGGALALAVSLRHPEAIAAAFPVGCWLPPALMPAARPPVPVPIEAFHGTADPVVPFETTKTALLRARDLGFPIELRQYEGVPHAIPGQERVDLLNALAEECGRQRGTR